MSRLVREHAEGQEFIEPDESDGSESPPALISLSPSRSPTPASTDLLHPVLSPSSSLEENHILDPVYVPILFQRCPNSCIAFTGAFANASHCPFCGEQRSCALETSVQR